MNTQPEEVQTIQEYLADQYRRKKGLRMKDDGAVFQNGKRLSPILTLHYKQKIREILKTKY